MSCPLRILATLLCLSTVRAGTAHASSPWVPPVSGGVEVARGFLPPARRWEPGHRGVDLVAALGSEVRAAGAGTVTFAGVLAGRGVVTVTHGALRSTYEPVAASVRVGDRVREGAVLGRLQPGHGRPGPGQSILHWGLRRGELYLDPLSLLRGGPVRLLAFWTPTPAPLSAVPGRQVVPVPGAAAAPAPGSPAREPAGAGPPARAAAGSGRGRPAPGGAVVAAMALATAFAATRRRPP